MRWRTTAISSDMKESSDGFHHSSTAVAFSLDADLGCIIWMIMMSVCKEKQIEIGSDSFWPSCYMSNPRSGWRLEFFTLIGDSRLELLDGWDDQTAFAQLARSWEKI